jgi:hypothetical protein
VISTSSFSPPSTMFATPLTTPSSWRSRSVAMILSGPGSLREVQPLRVRREQRPQSVEVPAQEGLKPVPDQRAVVRAHAASMAATVGGVERSRRLYVGPSTTRSNPAWIPAP